MFEIRQKLIDQLKPGKVYLGQKMINDLISLKKKDEENWSQYIKICKKKWIKNGNKKRSKN